MGKLVWLGAVLALVACDNNRNVAVSNSNPLGTVGGRVLDLDGEAPLANAMVTLETAGTTMMAMTDMTGTYTLTKVPAGDFFLTIAMAGYESAYLPGTLSGSVGNFPVSNPQSTVPTVELFKTDTTFAVALVDDRGAPVAGVPVTARPQVKYFAYDYPYGAGGSSFPTLTPFGQYTVNAVSDMNGIATFSGLPATVALTMINVNGTEVYVDVPPITIMGSTTYRWAGATFPLDPTRVTQPGGFPGGQANTITIPLVGPNYALTVVASSIDYLVTKASSAVGSVVPTDKPLSITFNQAVDDKTLRAQLLDENGMSLGNMTATFAAGNIVQLAAPASTLVAGKRYNLVLHADPLSSAGNGGVPYNVTAPFFTAGAATVSLTATLTTLPVAGSPFPAAGKVVVLTFSEPVGLGKASTAALPCVAWYETIDLDNSGGTVSYQGEYGMTPPACPGSPAPNAFDVTKITPMEPTPAPAIPVTGFASKWWVQVDDTTVAGGCKGGITVACTRPTTGTVMHLLFSHLDSMLTVTRANGQPVSDLMAAIQ